jgi:hypothetical protein
MRARVTRAYGASFLRAREARTKLAKSVTVE